MIDFIFSEDTKIPDGGVDPQVISDAKECYVGLVKRMNRVVNSIEHSEAVEVSALLPDLSAVIDQLSTDGRMLLGLAQAPRRYVERAAEPVQHPAVVLESINTMIYVIQIGISLGIGKERLAPLGLASLCCNMGLLNNRSANGEAPLELFQKRQLFYHQNAQDIHQYLVMTDEVQAIMDAFSSLFSSDTAALEQTSIYDQRMQQAMLIHVCQVFVFLSHLISADGRNAMSPTDAMKIMRGEMKDFFHPNIIKFFFNRLTIYPIGTLVMLSSKETAKIVAINENSMMRPEVLVVLDSSKQDKVPIQRVDLQANPNLFIRSTIVNDNLTERFIEMY